MSFSPYHQTELRVLAKVRARALQSSNAEAGCDRPFYFFQFDVSCAGRGEEVEDEEPYTYEGCWDAWGQELQSLEARTDKQTITSWQMCAPCCYRRCTLWGIWRCRWWRRSPSCLRQAMSKQAYLFVKNACAWQVLRSDFNWAAALPPELPVDAAKAGKHYVTCTILDTFGRTIEVMCGRSGDHILVIYTCPSRWLGSPMRHWRPFARPGVFLGLYGNTIMSWTTTEKITYLTYGLSDLIHPVIPCIVWLAPSWQQPSSLPPLPSSHHKRLGNPPILTGREMNSFARWL